MGIEEYPFPASSAATEESQATPLSISGSSGQLVLLFKKM